MDIPVLEFRKKYLPVDFRKISLYFTNLFLQEKSKAKWSVLDKGLTVPEDGSDEDEEMEA